jgi:hypothetical protein
MNWIRRVWRGEAALVVVFWLYGVLAVVVANALVGMASIPLASLGPIAVLAFLGASTLLLLTYQALVLVGIWRSAGRYPGWRPWAWLARAVVVLGCGFFGVAVWSGIIAPFRSHDSSRNSRNAAGTLRHDPAYPLTGFWKESCSTTFGLLVEPASAPGKYSVSFCGPGGCFTPGSYRPDTPIAGDSAYRVIDANHLEVQGQDGFSKYIRCD